MTDLKASNPYTIELDQEDALLLQEVLERYKRSPTEAIHKVLNIALYILKY